ncbi:MAG: HipA domain-containing protein [Bacteriovoracaceae bacterium]|nr:HipA domain-containing protein [Bacteriovoracaceae bacterium]
MPRTKNVLILDVYLNAEIVGKLTKQTTGALEFLYDESWLDRASSYPISQSLPLIETTYRGSEVFSFFENLLPDNLEIKNKMAQTLRASSTETFDLLNVAGQDCVGAFQFIAHGSAIPKVKEVEGDNVNDEQIEAILKNLTFNPLGNNYESDFRISIAGAQQKSALLWHNNEWIRPKGSTPTSHILKPPLGKFPSGIDMSTSVENEWLCAKVVRKLNLEVPDTRILKFGNQKCLVIERFDRYWSKDGKTLIRVPQEDLCQALGVNTAKKYESDGGPGIKQIMEFLNTSDGAYEDKKKFLKTQIIFFLLAAIDGHAKNFSIFQTESGFRLTPLYDILSAYPAISKHQIPMQRAKLAMAVGKSRHYKLAKICRRHFLETAKICSFPEKKMENMIDDIVSDVDALIKNGIETPTGFSEQVYNSIIGGIKGSLARLKLKP